MRLTIVPAKQLCTCYEKAHAKCFTDVNASDPLNNPLAVHYYYPKPHFIDKENEAQRGTHPRPHSLWSKEPWLVLLTPKSGHLSTTLTWPLRLAPSQAWDWRVTLVRETLGLLLASAGSEHPLPALYGHGSAPTGIKKVPCVSSASLSPPSSSLHMWNGQNLTWFRQPLHPVNPS